MTYLWMTKLDDKIISRDRELKHEDFLDKGVIVRTSDDDSCILRNSIIELIDDYIVVFSEHHHPKAWHKEDITWYTSFIVKYPERCNDGRTNPLGGSSNSEGEGKSESTKRDAIVLAGA